MVFCVFSKKRFHKKDTTPIKFLWAFLMVCVLYTSMLACTKSSDTVTTPNIPNPNPPVSPPTGEIQSFTLNDTLVAFEKGTVAKWLVNNTNNQTLVTFNGTKVGTYGVLETGPIKQNTTFTLAINNGQQASLLLKVADSVVTLLWNNGKRLKQTKSEALVTRVGQTNPIWVDTSFSDVATDQRIFFNLDGSTKIIQLNPLLFPTPADPGRVIVSASARNRFTWQGVTYTIVTLDNLSLIVTFDAIQTNGSSLFSRNTYKFE